MKYTITPVTAGLFDCYLSLVKIQSSTQEAVIASGVDKSEVDEKMEDFNFSIYSALNELLSFVGDSIRQNINIVQNADSIQI